ncbi:MAG: ATP-binding cassette domain-containing protein, partial [Smithellaceae bacterium]
MNALDISSVTFCYDGSPAPALRDFSMAVADGRTHALLGPNGAGKSTLMRIITGQLQGQTGGVSVYGLRMPDPKALSFIGC